MSERDALLAETEKRLRARNAKLEAARDVVLRGVLADLRRDLRLARAEAATSLKQGLEASRNAAPQRKRVAELEAELRNEREVPSRLSRLHIRVAELAEEALRAAEHNRALLITSGGVVMTNGETMLAIAE